jgi:hypothetical protein
MFRRVYGRAALLAVLLAAGCSPRPDPITIAENAVVVKNTSSRAWTKVMVTVNDHFTGGVMVLAAGGRLNAPLSQFRTGFGQRYDPSRQIVYKVEVTATDSKGEAVRLLWGGDRKR